MNTDTPNTDKPKTGTLKLKKKRVIRAADLPKAKGSAVSRKPTSDTAADKRPSKPYLPEQRRSSHNAPHGANGNSNGNHKGKGYEGGKKERRPFKKKKTARELMDNPDLIPNPRYPALVERGEEDRAHHYYTERQIHCHRQRWMIGAILKENFPVWRKHLALEVGFHKKALPVIMKKVVPLLPEEYQDVSRRTVRELFRIHVQSPKYLYNLGKGRKRYNMSGEVVGVVEEDAQVNRHRKYNRYWQTKPENTKHIQDALKKRNAFMADACRRAEARNAKKKRYEQRKAAGNSGDWKSK